MTSKNHILRRGKFTDLLLAGVASKFAATPVLLGDGEAPQGGGWSGQQAGSGNFVPYAILQTGTAVKNLQEPLRGRDTSWRLGYRVKAAGANRQQADFALDTARLIFSDLAHGVYACGVGAEVWKVLKSEYTQLGEVNPNNATDPATWEATDSLEIWLDLGP